MMRFRPALFLAFALGLGAGCATFTSAPTEPDLSFLHPIEDPGPALAIQCEAVSQAKKDQLHVFVINGLDPYYWGKLNGMCDYLKSVGFTHCYCAQLNQVKWYPEMIREIRAKNPEARIVLLGYSVGANVARNLAHELKHDNTKIDLLIYVGGDMIQNVSYSRPENVASILNINGHGLWVYGYDLFMNGAEIEQAKNHRLDLRHFELPGRAQTVELVARGLIEMCENYKPR